MPQVAHRVETLYLALPKREYESSPGIKEMLQSSSRLVRLDIRGPVSLKQCSYAPRLEHLWVSTVEESSMTPSEPLSCKVIPHLEIASKRGTHCNCIGTIASLKMQEASCRSSLVIGSLYLFHCRSSLGLTSSRCRWHCRPHPACKISQAWLSFRICTG